MKELVFMPCRKKMYKSPKTPLPKNIHKDFNSAVKKGNEARARMSKKAVKGTAWEY